MSDATAQVESQIGTEDDPFGFGQTTTARDRLKLIRPAPLPEVSDTSKVDRIAESMGFTSREPATEASRPPVAPTPPTYSSYSRLDAPRPRLHRDPINMQVPEDIAQVFRRFCKKERYSYPEGLEEIMRRAGLLSS